MRKNIYCIIDTETSGALYKPYCYDVAALIFDRTGKELARYNWLVREVWGNVAQMKTAYYAYKIPLYDNINAHLVNAMQFAEEFVTFLTENKVNYLLAYNLSFDIRSINNVTTKFLSGLLFNPEWKNFDVWGCACEVLLNSKKFRTMAEKNGWISGRGNYRTSAEIAYRFITGEVTFDESHTAMDDCEIEKEIFITCLNKKKKMSGGIINNPWRLVQTKSPKQLPLF